MSVAKQHQGEDGYKNQERMGKSTRLKEGLVWASLSYGLGLNIGEGLVRVTPLEMSESGSADYVSRSADSETEADIMIAIGILILNGRGTVDVSVVGGKHLRTGIRHSGCQVCIVTVSCDSAEGGTSSTNENVS